MQYYIMNLQPIEAKEEGTAAADGCIRCNSGLGSVYMIQSRWKPEDGHNPYPVSWNEAARQGWMWDQEGTPFQAYYCKHCADMLIKDNK